VSGPGAGAEPGWADAALAAALFGVDPPGTGGVLLRSPAGPVRDRWLGLVRESLPPCAPVRRVPVHVSDGRLLGGLDLASTLRAGRPVAERGLLAEAHGGVVLLSMAERLPVAAAARIAAVLDAGEVAAERDALTLRSPARFGVVALDEGGSEDEQAPAALRDRLAFQVGLAGIRLREAAGAAHSPDAVAAARARLPAVRADEAILEALCASAMALGIPSLRVPLLALRAARAAAALAGREAVSEDDAAAAARLVLAPRATMLPASEETPEEAPAQDAGAQAQNPPGTDTARRGEEAQAAPGQGRGEGKREAGAQAASDPDPPAGELVLAAARAAIPADLLARLGEAQRTRSRQSATGKVGALQDAPGRGRPAGVRRGEPRAGARLNVVETLRAAAPWQPLRRREAGASGTGRPRIEVRSDDFRMTRFKRRAESATVFAVDASGSAALHRLAEAKGAVELLLADCYVRRDRVALVAFRGRSAEVVLPPTRSLVRAKRSLASLPGGGGTPLASGIDTALGLAESVRRQGLTPTLILLTDGRANVSRDGQGGRARAQEQAVMAARAVRAAGLRALLVDTAPRPQPLASRLAAEMGATYLALPYADAAAISEAVRAGAG